MGDGTIRLALPAAADYGRVARTTVAGLALRLGFTYRDIEDLRLAIDETLILLLRPDAPAERVVLTFEPTDGGMVIDARVSPDLPTAATAVEPRALRRFERLVKPIIDTWSVTDDARHVHLVKQRA
jgi:serine/threonine-protein kinase RsbW